MNADSGVIAAVLGTADVSPGWRVFGVVVVAGMVLRLTFGKRK